METRETAIATSSSSGGNISLRASDAIQKKPAADEQAGFFRALGRWARYLYFLRFSLALWLFAPVMCLLNMKDKTLTSGILVPDYAQQYFCIGFFLASAAFAALVLARIVVINGPERWDLDYGPDQEGSRPRFLTNLLVNNKSEREGMAVVLSQIPNLLVLLYMLRYGTHQGVEWWRILTGVVGGAVVAWFFWWLPNAWYYLTYRTPKADLSLKTFALGKNAARTILYPRRVFSLNRPGDNLPGSETIEQGSTALDKLPVIGWIVRNSGFQFLKNWLATQPGYGTAPGYGTMLYESHSFAFVAFFALLGLYLLVWPLTAPVPARAMSIVAIAAMVLFSALILVVFWTVGPADPGVEQETADRGASEEGPAKALKEADTRTQFWIKKAKLRRVQRWLTLGTVIFNGTVIALYFSSSASRFPIFATVLILMIAACWTLAGLAFFLDRYRVPVVTLLLLLTVVPRMLHLDRNPFSSLGASQEEHYLSTSVASGAVSVPTPAEILTERLASIQDGKPLIIVTATGGGLHASAWTVAVLGHLEKELGGDFHKHLLLASTVSGGSVGLLNYLRELDEGTLDGAQRDAAIDRMGAAAQCSSLEGVGWGLVYYDLPKTFIPFLPYFIPPSSGVGDLAASPLLKDRTWSLRKSFERNLADADAYCAGLWKADGNPVHGWNSDQAPPAQPAGAMTLRHFLHGDAYPAFAMNTTVTETGERFLLANYDIPYRNLDCGPNYRARSYLATYGSAPGADGMYSDLPLATAAQMSATFPYVSSAARVPVDVDHAVDSVHFVDGGYYDNDGTASAIEFLHYALGPPGDSCAAAAVQADPPAKQEPSANPGTDQTGQKPLRILLLEIRNSGDIAGSAPEKTAPARNGGTTPWNLFNQVTAPLLGFWQGGHESVTARNQAGLELLEEAMGDRLQLHRIVFADLCSEQAANTDPLNWSLTPLQRKEVVSTASDELPSRYQEAKQWFDSDTWHRDPGSEDEQLKYTCPKID